MLVEDLCTYLCVKELIVCVSDLHFYSRRNFTHGRLKFFENYQLKYTLAQKKYISKKSLNLRSVLISFLAELNCQTKLSNRYR